MLEIARVLAASNATFRYTIRVATFCGEEQVRPCRAAGAVRARGRRPATDPNTPRARTCAQGLVGSRAYARQLSLADADIVAMLQADMIGYQVGARPELSFVNRYTDAALTSIVQNLTKTVCPAVRARAPWPADAAFSFGSTCPRWPRLRRAPAAPTTSPSTKSATRLRASSRPAVRWRVAAAAAAPCRPPAA
jgi:hypothetical protein